MKIKIVFDSCDDGKYSVKSPVFPLCIGNGENRSAAQIDWHNKISAHVAKAEEGLTKQNSTIVDL